MRKAGFAISTLLALGMGIGSQSAEGQIAEFTYTGPTGSQTWQSAANWGGSGFPNGAQDVANLRVPLAGDLSINLGSAGSDVTLAGLKIGGAAGAVTTDIVSNGAVLRLQNDFVEDLANADFNNNSFVDGGDFLIWQRSLGLTNQESNANGDADLNGTVEGIDLTIWEANFGKNATGINNGRSEITTGNVAGSINRISADVRLVAESVDVIGLTDLVVDGALSYENDAPVEGGIDASINNTSRGITTTLNGSISLVNQSGGVAGRLGLNTSPRSNGTLVVNGVVSDGGTMSDLQIGVAENGLATPLNTVVINSANDYGGGTTLSRVNLILNDPAALGSGTVSHDGPANQYGYNLIAGGGGLNAEGELVIANPIRMGQWQSFRGDHSIRLTGLITQTNNRGFVNLLAPGQTLTLDGQIDIWEDDEALTRRFQFEGDGTTVVTGLIRDDPLSSGGDRRIRKSGSGVLVIDVAAGDNAHSGITEVIMGNLHYANNDSLNVGPGLILARGGAVGVDTGVANNAAFAAKLDPSSTGGLMLAASDAAAALNFTGVLANAAQMTVAAPEAGMTYTGTITPANSTYALGGGSGQLTLPGAQLTGANSVEIRNGGSVELLGDNSYTGVTRILTKYTSTQQARAAADNSQNISGQFYQEIAPTLIVDDLADGGEASSIGAAASDAANLFIQGSTLKYLGTGDSTNRLFTIGTGGATIDSSGSGAVSFTNSGSLGRDDAEPRNGTLDDFAGQPNEAIELADTSDIIVGMSVNDPLPGGTFTQPPCEPDGANCIPAGTTVTGISEDGTTIGLSNDFPFILKENTQLVFGTVERTLTLTGSNSGNNVLASIISDSPLGGVVAVEKTGTGKWILSGANAYSGDTIVEEGVLSITNAFLDDDAAVRLTTGSVLDLNFAGADVIDDLFINAVAQPVGLWGAPGNVGATFTSSLLSGTGLLSVGGAATLALGAVPEPSACLLLALAASGLACTRRRERGTDRSSHIL